MARRSPETQAKRRREVEKQEKRQEKAARRAQRKAQRATGEGGPSPAAE
jgi:hypothetical protein